MTASIFYSEFNNTFFPGESGLQLFSKLCPQVFLSTLKEFLAIKACLLDGVRQSHLDCFSQKLPQSSLAQSSCDDLELELELSGEQTEQWWLELLELHLSSLRLINYQLSTSTNNQYMYININYININITLWQQHVFLTKSRSTFLRLCTASTVVKSGEIISISFQCPRSRWIYSRWRLRRRGSSPVWPGHLSLSASQRSPPRTCLLTTNLWYQNNNNNNNNNNNTTRQTTRHWWALFTIMPGKMSGGSIPGPSCENFSDQEQDLGMTNLWQPSSTNTVLQRL